MKYSIQQILLMLKTVILVFLSMGCYGQSVTNTANYLDSIKVALEKEWPKNSTINLVFHGHSVPAGYFKTPRVHTLSAYPYLTLKMVKERYPTAVVNSIVTAIGGEQSEQGAARFKDEVLPHKPDVLFIDYALNDRSIGLKRAKIAWEKMIVDALAQNIKVVLLTPTPHLREDILFDSTRLEQHSKQIRTLASTYEIGLVDSYAIFKNIAKKETLKAFMAQSNHINEKGHELVAKAIMVYFY